jgi:hypothetical protein
MLKPHREGLITALAILAISAPAWAAAPEKGESALVRVADAPDDDARGEVRIRTHKKDQRLWVRVTHIDAAADVDLYLENAGGVMEFVGSLEPGNDEAEDAAFRYRARLKKGQGELPFGVSSVAELQGRAIEIRIGAASALTGHVPMLGISPRKHHKARVTLDPTDAAPDDARARLRLRSKPFKGDERFELMVVDFALAEDDTLLLFLEDPANPGTWVDLGDFEQHPHEIDEHRYRRRTRKGAPLPFFVDAVSDLGGLAVEVRDGDGNQVWFEGVVPNFD